MLGRSLVLLLCLLCVAPAPAGAIFHGREVPPEEAPWLVALRGRGHVCGGVLVARDRVVTAAHCVQGVAPGRLRVEIGGGEAPRATLHRRYDRVVMPRDYAERPSPVSPSDPSRNSSWHDFAVLRLDTPVDGVAPLPLATAPPADGERTITYGRGRTGPAARLTGPDDRDPGAPPAAPLAAEQAVVASAACREAYAWLAPASHLCTQDPGERRAQACAGDSGGPVVVSRDGGPQLVALVTWGGETRGRDCGEGLPDVSERVLPLAGLVATDFARTAPYAVRRTRVRRSGGVLTCVSGPWRGGGVRLRVSWHREGGRPLRGVHRRRIRARSTPLGCTVRASNPAGWAEEVSYNQR